MDRAIVDEVTSLLDPVLSEKGLFLVDLVVRGRIDNAVLEVFIDGDEPVGTDMCAVISRTFSGEIDRRGVFPGGYSVTVSSPGLDRPIRYPRQYPKHVGRKIMVKAASGSETVDISGTLLAVTDDAILIGEGNGGESRRVPFADIRTAKIIPRW